MFPAAPVPDVAFSSTFWPASSDDDDDDFPDPGGCGAGLCWFHENSPMPSGSGRGSLGGLPFTSTPLSHGGQFLIALGKTGAPISVLGAPPQDDEDLMPLPYNEELELGMEADNEDDESKFFQFHAVFWKI